MANKTQALQLLARFAFAPNTKGYCGKDSAPAKFLKCITEGKCQPVEDEITQFIALYPYLKTLATILKKPIYSYKVAEAYWIGNDELKKTKPQDYTILLENFKQQGVPDFFIENLKQKPPKIFIPYHLFQILHIGVGRISGTVPYNLETINNCMVRWGTVENIENHHVTAHVNTLEIHNKKYTRVEKTVRIAIDEKFVPNLKIGDTIAVHWHHLAKILTEKEINNITYWTDTIIESITP